VVYRGASFDEILDNFLKEQNLKMEELQASLFIGTLNPNKANLSDPILKDKWIAYHETHMNLAVVPKQKNCQKEKKKNVTPTSEPSMPVTEAEGPPLGTQGTQGALGPLPTFRTTVAPSPSPLTTENLHEVGRFCSQMPLPVSAEESFILKSFL
jgi:hypothetical protein